MTRRRQDQSFTQRDLTRAMKATQAAGIKARYEVDTMRKKITVIPNDLNDGGATGNTAAGNPWDEVLTHAEDTKRPT